MKTKSKAAYEFEMYISDRDRNDYLVFDEPVLYSLDLNKEVKRNLLIVCACVPMGTVRKFTKGYHSTMVRDEPEVFAKFLRLRDGKREGLLRRIRSWFQLREGRVPGDKGRFVDA